MPEDIPNDLPELLLKPKVRYISLIAFNFFSQKTLLLQFEHYHLCRWIAANPVARNHEVALQLVV
jgi:hypothetical protein